MTANYRGQRDKVLGQCSHPKVSYPMKPFYALAQLGWSGVPDRFIEERSNLKSTAVLSSLSPSTAVSTGQLPLAINSVSRYYTRLPLRNEDIHHEFALTKTHKQGWGNSTKWPTEMTEIRERGRLNAKCRDDGFGRLSVLTANSSVIEKEKEVFYWNICQNMRYVHSINVILKLTPPHKWGSLRHLLRTNLIKTKIKCWDKGKR